MEFKKRNEPVCTSDFWYDLTSGGYIKPEELLKDEEDVKLVKEAIKTILTFEQKALDAGVIESM